MCIRRAHVNTKNLALDYNFSGEAVARQWLDTTVAQAMYNEVQEFEGWLVRDKEVEDENAPDGLFGFTQDLAGIGEYWGHFHKWIQLHSLGYFESIVKEKVSWVLPPMVTRFEPGHYLRRHTDALPKRIWTVNLNLTPQWSPDLGGNLVRLHKEHGWVYTPPEFNRMILFRVDTWGKDHFVDQIATYADRHRYALTGWLTRVDPVMGDRVF